MFFWPCAVFLAVAAGTVPFRNQSSPTGEKYLIETMTGGVALLDYDGDGRLDIFLVNGAALQDPMPKGARPDKSDPRFWNRLYRNTPAGFIDVTERAGVRGHSYGMGAAVGDYDNDGRPDLYVTNFGENNLYRNLGDGRFEDVTANAGVKGGGWSTAAAFVDYDRDGDLDLFVARYLEWDFALNKWCGARQRGHRSYCHPDEFKPVSQMLFRNNGDGTFADVSRTAGVAVESKALGVAINDYNRDGWPDIAVANDSWPQQLFRNNGDGTFREVGLTAGIAYDEDGRVYAGMGIDFADYDNDGWPDLFVNALANQRYWLYRNVKGSFEPVTGKTGLGELTRLSSGWGARFLDYDNDGLRDIFVAQGHVMDNIELTQPGVRYREPLALLRNLGGEFTRAAVPGFDVPLAARGAATGDLNGDGFLDIVVNCNNGPAVVHINRGGRGHWLSIDLQGRRSNRDGIGGRVRVETGSGREQHGFVSTASSYLSASDKRVHFGLGEDRAVRLIEVTWPSGTVQRLENVEADSVVKVVEPEK